MPSVRQDVLGSLKEEVEAEARDRAAAHQQKTQVEAVIYFLACLVLKVLTMQVHL